MHERLTSNVSLRHPFASQSRTVRTLILSLRDQEQTEHARPGGGMSTCTSARMMSVSAEPVEHFEDASTLKKADNVAYRFSPALDDVCANGASSFEKSHSQCPLGTESSEEW
jgi:hypothetical protein